MASNRENYIGIGILPNVKRSRIRSRLCEAVRFRTLRLHPRPLEFEFIKEVFDVAYRLLLHVQRFGVSFVRKLSNTLKNWRKKLVVRKPPSNARRILEDLGHPRTASYGIDVSVSHSQHSIETSQWISLAA